MATISPLRKSIIPGSTVVAFHYFQLEWQSSMASLNEDLVRRKQLTMKILSTFKESVSIAGEVINISDH